MKRRVMMGGLLSALAGCQAFPDSRVSPSRRSGTDRVSPSRTGRNREVPPDGPVEPADNIVTVRRDGDRILIRTEQWTKESYSEVQVSKEPDPELDPVSLDFCLVSDLPALRNALAYFGYVGEIVIVETGKERGKAVANTLHDEWESERESKPEQDEYFEYSGYTFEVFTGYVG